MPTLKQLAKTLSDAVIEAKSDECNAFMEFLDTREETGGDCSDEKALVEFYAAKATAISSVAEAAFNSAKPAPVTCDYDKRVQARADKFIRDARRIYDNRIAESEAF
jgi:hypothetical protein